MISSVVSGNSSIPLLADTSEKSSSTPLSADTNEEKSSSPLPADTSENSISRSVSERLNIDLQNSKNITINTSEGDVVTISSSEEFHTGYYSYQDVASGSGNISLQENRQLEISTAKSFSLSVEGDLSKQEIKDIKKSLKLVNKILSGYQSGDIKKVLKNVSKIGNLDTIANLEAAMLQVSSISYEHQSTAGTAYPTSGEIEPDTPVVATDGSQTSVNQGNIISENEYSEQEVKDTYDSSPDIKEGVNTVADNMVDVLKNSHVKADKLAKSVQKFFSKLLQNFSRGGFNNALTMNISKMIKNDFYKKISDEQEKRFARNKYSEDNIENEAAPILNNTV